MANRKYPAKLLLFGEYTVLVGSRALAIPVPHWSGEWKSGEKVDAGLTALADYIKKSSFHDHIDLDTFRNDIADGLRFESSIPWGYGLGSSASLTAAVFDKYGVEHDGTSPSKTGVSVNEIIKQLVSIESFYHGHSSGLDPLVSYLNRPVLHENGSYHTVDLRRDEETPQIFLINSGIERFTAPLVALFKSRLADPKHVRDVINPLKINVDHVIDHFLTGSWELFWDNMHLISEMQFERFKEMMPEPIEYIWQGVRRNSDISIKLCGAGGGGYFLGFARPGIDVESELGCAVEMIDLVN